jgi:MFS superfamily sulfate permease-like transporter
MTQKKSSILSDITSGFMVFLIALPLCLGISKASGFEGSFILAGILTAVIGGLVGPFLGSAPLTIKGPAAGLIVIVAGAVQDLGSFDIHGNIAVFDANLGVARTLAVGVVSGALQIIFSRIGVASLVAVAPISVVHGVLAGIGITIFSKQIHFISGADLSTLGIASLSNPIQLLSKIPTSFSYANISILIIGLVSLGILFSWTAVTTRIKMASKIPAPLLVLLVAVPLGIFFNIGNIKNEVGMDLPYLLSLPSEINFPILTPIFDMIFHLHSLKWILMFALIGTLESVLSAMAVDALDPNRSASDLHKDLLATGTANFLSAWVGGLPMISEIVRSKANIDNGAKSAWSNFFHGIFLLFFVVLFSKYLNYIPIAALAAMLVFAGSRLASITEFQHAQKLGWDQFTVFLMTVIATLLDNLLTGIFAGLFAEILIHAYRLMSFTKISSEINDGVLNVKIKGPATFFLVMKIMKALEPANQADIHQVIIDIRECPLMDHTVLERIHLASLEWPNAADHLEYLESADMKHSSSDPTAARYF